MDSCLRRNDKLIVHTSYLIVRTLSHDTIILEIAVDRLNEKGVFVAREMLLTLHDTIGKHEWWQVFPHHRPQFRFFVIHHGGRIRFFIETEEVHAEFLESQLYAHYSDIEITRTTLPFAPETTFVTEEARLSSISPDTIKLYVNLKDRTEKESIDPLSSITSVLAKSPKEETVFFRVDFSPLHDHDWREHTPRSIIESSAFPYFFKKILLTHWWWLRFFAWPFTLLARLVSFLSGSSHEGHTTDAHIDHAKGETKFDTFGYATRIVMGSTGQGATRVRELASSLTIFASPSGTRFKTGRPQKKQYRETLRGYSPYQSILSATELAGLVHLPTLYVKTPGVNWVTTRKFEPPHNLPSVEAPNTPIGISNFRGSTEGFGIQPIDRARHIYIIGKTGMGKSTLLENMIYSDILAGRGVGLIDPHGDLAETILASIPKSRTNDIVLFDPSDVEYPIAFNMLESPSPELRPIVGSGLVSIFKKMFAESWWPRLEYILRNTILTLLTVPDATLISIPLILTHESYRRKIVSKLKDPILVQFWTQEFEKMSPNMMSEAVNPILNKVGQFLSSPILRNILGQPKNPFSMRWVMDNGKIFIVNLSKGKIGEDASALLGAMMVTKFQIEAMTRADMPEKDRRDFGLYVDEFQNFATDSFATILSEARKYKLSLTMANQYIAQMPETVQGAVFGNVGSLVSFQVGHQDGVVLSDIFGGEDVILPQDLTNLRKYDIYTKLLIDGMPSPVFSATTYSPLHTRIDVPAQQSRDTLLKVSREKYTKKRDFVEKKIFEYAGKVTEEEGKYRRDQEAYKEKKKEEARLEREKAKTKE